MLHRLFFQFRTKICHSRESAYVDSHRQKGGVENAIGRLRAFLPRKTDLAELNNQDMEQVVAQYNHTPRKCLGYKTPAQVFTKQLVHFKCESTSPDFQIPGKPREVLLGGAWLRWMRYFSEREPIIFSFFFGALGLGELSP